MRRFNGAPRAAEPRAPRLCPAWHVLGAFAVTDEGSWGDPSLRRCSPSYSPAPPIAVGSRFCLCRVLGCPGDPDGHRSRQGLEIRPPRLHCSPMHHPSPEASGKINNDI